MYPMYKLMNSHPYQFDPRYYPHFELNPPHMNINPARSPLPYDSWYGGNPGYSYPSQCHSCCSHNYSPSQCAFRTPYPYFPPSPYSNCAYAAYPGMYPPAHYVPPPHFAMEQPRYEYEKNMNSDHHCCGFSNHQCNNKGVNSLKIEGHDQDKKSETNESVVPFGFKDYPYPVWIPPDYMKSRESTKPNAFEGREQEEPQKAKSCGDARSFEQPNVWNVWSPYHGNNLESKKQKDESHLHQHQPDGNKRHFPFPIIWMPYEPEETGGKVSKETASGHYVDHESTSPSKYTIPRLHDAEQDKRNSRENEVVGGSKVSERLVIKDPVLKNIPVKQVENEKVVNKNAEDVPQRHDGDTKERKITQDGVKKQPSSPSRSAKLPPVCLRVDPLPRKKSISRSPSPPGEKRKSLESSNDRSKEDVQHDKSSTICMPEKSMETEPSKSKPKVDEVVNVMSKEVGHQDQNIIFPDTTSQRRDQTDKVDTSIAVNEPKHNSSREGTMAAETHSSNKGHQISEAREAANGKADVADDMKRERRIALSDDKAAVMIQSAFRGFNVRRWEPLKKLKQITEIKEQMAELKNRIQELESSDDSGVTNKQRTIITEVVMSLLLKLDSIQGLHPTVREHRKSVARELVSLQEKLDSLNCKKQSAENLKFSDDTCRVEDDGNVPVEDDVHLGGQEVQKMEQDVDFSKGGESTKFDGTNPCEEQPLCVTDSLFNSHHIDNAEVVADKEENKNVEGVIENFSSGNSVETKVVSAETPLESKDNQNDEILHGNAEEHDKVDFEQSLPNLRPVSEEKVVNYKFGGCALNEGVDELKEIPLRVLDGGHKEESIQIDKDKVLQHEKTDLTACIPEEKEADTEEVKHHLLEELGESLAMLGPENTCSSEGQKENLEVLEQEKEQERPLNEAAETFDVDDSTKLKNNEEKLEHCGGYALNGFPSHSQEDVTTVKESTEAAEAEEPITVEVPQENGDIEILDDIQSGKTIEPSVETQMSSSPCEEVIEYHVQDEQKVLEENIEVQGEEPTTSIEDAIIVSNDEAKKYNVEVEQELSEVNVEVQEEEPVAEADDNPAPATEEPADGDNVIAAPTSEAATTELELSKLNFTKEGNVSPLTFGSTTTEAMDAKEIQEWNEGTMTPLSPTASQVSFNSDAISESERKLMEENERLREMMEKLMEAGKEQLTAISTLSGRVKDLEKRLSKKKKLKMKRNGVPKSGSSCLKLSNDSLTERAMGMAM